VPDRTLTVLHIDDDAGLSRLVSRTLGRQGFVVENAVDAAEGLARIARGGIDAVVLDHYLRSGTGMNVLEALSELEHAPPVVYVTGSSEPTVAVDALKAGAADYVHKTVGEEFFVLLESALHQSLEKARLEREKERAEQEVRAAKERAEILLAEVNHRVANSLSLVAALVRMQASATKEPEARDALAETQVRISAIANLHRKLYTSEDVRSVNLEEYISALIHEIDASMKAAGHQSRMRAELETVLLPTDKAVSVGMIVTELITNAYKYAYPQGSDGEVRVVLRRSDETRAILTVEDDGVGFSGTGTPKGTGMGTRIVKAMASSLGTAVEYDPRERGTRARMELLLEVLAPH
jgi:two-component sensor histidine kinase